MTYCSDGLGVSVANGWASRVFKPLVPQIQPPAMPDIPVPQIQPEPEGEMPIYEELPAEQQVTETEKPEVAKAGFDLKRGGLLLAGIAAGLLFLK